MKVRSLRILVCLMIVGIGVAPVHAQVYQTAQSASAAKAYTPHTGSYSPTPISTTSTADYIGAVDPYANTKFVSTASSPSSYTISVSALDMGSVGEAQTPFYTPGIMKAPPGPGDVIKDPIGDVSGGVPVGDGTWLLLACAAMLAAFRAWQTWWMKKV